MWYGVCDLYIYGMWGLLHWFVILGLMKPTLTHWSKSKTCLILMSKFSHSPLPQLFCFTLYSPNLKSSFLTGHLLCLLDPLSLFFCFFFIPFYITHPFGSMVLQSWSHTKVIKDAKEPHIGPYEVYHSSRCSNDPGNCVIK